MLVGHDDSNGPRDIGRLRITYHHNWFDGSIQRNPRVRFGEPVHVFNYYCEHHRLRRGFANERRGHGRGQLLRQRREADQERRGRNRRQDRGQAEHQRQHRGPDCPAGSVVEPNTFYSYRLDDAASIPSIVVQFAGVGKL